MFNDCSKTRPIVILTSFLYRNAQLYIIIITHIILPGVSAERGGNVARLVEYRTGTSATQVRFPGAARDFSPRVNFQC